MHSQPSVRAVSRPLTDEERSLLRSLLQQSGENGVRYLAELPQLHVTGECSCGCPSIIFATGAALPAAGMSNVFANFEGHTGAGEMVEVHLRELGSAFVEMEVVNYENPTSSVLPDASSLRHSRW